LTKSRMKITTTGSHSTPAPLKKHKDAAPRFTWALRFQ
jgi:hypothetical protein